MKQTAWIYVGIIWGMAVAFSLSSFISGPQTSPPLILFFILTLTASLMRFFVIDAPHYRSYEGSTIIFMVSLWFLPPWLFILLVLIAHTVEWFKERWVQSDLLRNWYIQPFNAAKTIIGGWSAYVVLSFFDITAELPISQLSALGILLLVITYTIVNQLLLAGVLFLARGRSFWQTGVLRDVLLIEVPLACIGCIAIEVMHSNLWMGVFVLAPIILIYQAFMLPKLQYATMHSLENFNRDLTLANHEIQQLNDELFLTLAKIFDARDPYVGNHAAQVAAYAVAIATELGLSRERVELIRQSGYLHDIGKIAIPEAILHKPATLTAAEFAFIKKHANIGADFVATSHGLSHLAPFIRHHHERWDGRGYPDQLAGEAIPLEARILNICDSVEAMASDRPYSRAMSIEEIVAELLYCAGKQFDPAVVAAFIRVVEQGGTRLIVNSARAVHDRHSQSTREEESTMVQYLSEIYGVPFDKTILPSHRESIIVSEAQSYHKSTSPIKVEVHVKDFYL